MLRAATRLLPALAAAFLLNACATAKIGLTQQEVASLNITSVDVRYAPDMKFWWGNAEREYAKQKGVPEDNVDGGAYEKLIASPGAKDYQRRQLTALVKRALNAKVLPNFRGNRPVRLQVTVKSFRIPSIAQTVLIGGSPTFEAETALIDATSKKRLGSQKIYGEGPNTGGVGGVIANAVANPLFGTKEEIAVKTYARNVLTWIKGSNDYEMGL